MNNFTVNYQTVTTPDGLKHVYTFRDAPYSIYLDNPIENFLLNANIVDNTTKMKLKSSKYVSDQEFINNLQHIERCGEPLSIRTVFATAFQNLNSQQKDPNKDYTSFPELVIMATHYPPVPQKEFYKCVFLYYLQVKRYPTYEEALKMAFVDNLVHYLTSTYDMHTTWGTAKEVFTPQPDFSNGFYEPKHEVLYKVEGVEFDNCPVLLMTAWEHVWVEYICHIGANRDLDECLDMSLPSICEFIVHNPNYFKLVLSFYFSGLDPYNFIYTNKANLESLFKDMSTNSV